MQLFFRFFLVKSNISRIRFDIWVPLYTGDIG